MNIEGGPRYKPPEVSRGSPVLHYSLTISVGPTIATIVYFYMCNLINSCSSSSSSSIRAHTLGKKCLQDSISQGLAKPCTHLGNLLGIVRLQNIDLQLIIY